MNNKKRREPDMPENTPYHDDAATVRLLGTVRLWSKSKESDAENFAHASARDGQPMPSVLRTPSPR